ncbi:MAG: helix-turn-helix transcriptional regulator [Ectothiorhodospiraceae bacterium]|nr:helix-turn-helix transcriptional regulator [Ectothiorhodospiraceae bacterium]
MGQFINNAWIYPMSIQQHLIALRHDKGLTQQEMADMIGVHVNQIRRYESGATQPSLEVLKRLAVALSITIDSLVFDEAERGPSDDLRLQFERINRFDDEEKKIVKALLEGLILKHEAKQLAELSR